MRLSDGPSCDRSSNGARLTERCETLGRGAEDVDEQRRSKGEDTIEAPRAGALRGLTQLRLAHRVREEREIVEPAETEEAMRACMHGEKDELVFRRQHSYRREPCEMRITTAREKRLARQDPPEGRVAVEVQLERQRIGVREVKVMVLASLSRFLRAIRPDKTERGEDGRRPIEIAGPNQEIDVARRARRGPWVETLGEQRPLQRHSRERGRREAHVDPLQQSDVRIMVESTRDGECVEATRKVRGKRQPLRAPSVQHHSAETVALGAREEHARIQPRRYAGKMPQDRDQITVPAP